MKKNKQIRYNRVMQKYTSTVLLVLAAIVLFVIINTAQAVEKNEWCHCAESGVCNTLDLPQQALEQAGHVNASGNPLHAGDHAGACVEPTDSPEETPLPTDNPEQTIVPTASPEPSQRPSSSPAPTVISCPEDYHLNASGQVCVKYEYGAAPPPGEFEPLKQDEVRGVKK